MEIEAIRVTATPAEIDSSEDVRALLERLFQLGGAVVMRPDEATGTPGPHEGRQHFSHLDQVPGVAAEGQEDVARLLDENPAQSSFRSFLQEATSWDNVVVRGITPKGSAAGQPTDYTRYLRLRRTGSQYGGFAYVWPASGTVELRLTSATAGDLTHAPAAYPVSKGHPQYSVSIKIIDDDTRDQALRLARTAYGLT